MSELDDSIVVKPSVKRLSEINMNNSYKIVNEKIMKLKKLEYDYCNMCEVMKHFAVVQELIVKGLYDFPNEVTYYSFSWKVLLTVGSSTVLNPSTITWRRLW